MGIATGDMIGVSTYCDGSKSEGFGFTLKGRGRDFRGWETQMKHSTDPTIKVGFGFTGGVLQGW
jgi:hypothetical protein